MSDTVIRVENLAKKYVLGQERGMYTYKTLRGAMTNAAKSFADVLNPRTRKAANPGLEEFWALKDVSIDIQQGDVVGIIGRNGAGKSTLLKILSRITEPTKGSIRIKGRVASLLEVGTGFHPELTGRENIFLNGVILGMSKAEIQSKFDEIVAFAELEKFLDTPVKRYSSGMYVRLAFAVAAHLEPEILIVDEVLAVGDTAFQKKCLGKLDRVGKEGRTVIFVSHDLQALGGLCSKAYLLNKGSVIQTGKPSEVIQFYTSMLGGSKDEIYNIVSYKLNWRGISNRYLLDNLSHNDDLKFIFDFEVGDQDIENLHVDCAIFNEKDECVIHTKSKFIGEGFSVKRHEKFSVEYVIKTPNLSPGAYHMTVYAYIPEEVLFWADRIKACFVSSISSFENVKVLDGIKSAIVPKFDVKIQSPSYSES
jgi:lipopolysaccharide transport system ATP-binding protein